MMNELKIHYAPTCNTIGKSTIRLRHLKYVKSINYSTADMKVKKLLGHNNLSFKKEFYSVKTTDKLEVSEVHMNQLLLFTHLNRLARSLKKISFLLMYGSKTRINSMESKNRKRLFLESKRITTLNFNYEIQDPNFSNYEQIYEKILTMESQGNDKAKFSAKVESFDIWVALQNAKIVLPKNIVLIVGFRVSNEVLDYPPVNRFLHDNNNYLWNLAAAYITLSNVRGYYAFKFDSNYRLRKIFLSSDSSNKYFDYFKRFLARLSNIDALHLSLKGVITNDQEIFFRDYAALIQPKMRCLDELKSLVIDCEDINFDPLELENVYFPESLTHLQLNLKDTKINSLRNIHYIEQFPNKLVHLRKLKTFKLGLPTTCLINQMIHNLPETLTEIEYLHLDFPERSKEVVYEEIYLNSLLESLSNMPNLQELYLSTEKLNYTYCAYLAQIELPLSLQRLQWIDGQLYCSSRSQKQVQTKQWIECKKFEDLNIILSLLSESLEYLEIPFVFDGLETEFVALRFLELVSELKNLTTLNLSFGFKTLDEASVELVNNFVKALKSVFGARNGFKMNLNIFYRKIKGNLNIDDLNKNQQTFLLYTNEHVQYIHDIHY